MSTSLAIKSANVPVVKFTFTALFGFNPPLLAETVVLKEDVVSVDIKLNVFVSVPLSAVAKALIASSLFNTVTNPLRTAVKLSPEPTS